MSDPVLPVVGFGIAAIGFLVTVRNGIDLILRDKNNVKNSYVRDLVLVGAELTILEDRLELWKQYWRLFDPVLRSLLESLWGGDGAADIQKLLGVTEDESKKINEEFEKMYGRVRNDARERLLKSEPLEQVELMSKRHRQVMSKRIREEYDKTVKLPEKTKHALFDAPTFRTRLETLKSAIESLDAMSTIKYEKMNPGYKYDEDRIKKLGLQLALFSFVKGTAQPINNFIIWCKQQGLPETIAIDFPLDLAYESGTEERDKFLTNKASNHGYPYYLTLSNNATAEGTHFRIALKSEEELTDLAQKIQDLATESDSQDGQHNATHQPTQSSKSLRKILLSSPKKLLESEYHPFSQLERYKLAYELSEVAMVLLKSEALCDLCVCAIRRICHNAARQDYEHLLRIKNAHELQSASQAEGPDRWCRKELPDMHILRLGIVLVEIATGGVVKNAKFDEEVKLTLEIPGDPPVKLEDCSPCDIALVVKAAGGEDLSWAVHYCLQSDVMPAAVDDEGIIFFYNKVVAPLYIHYEDQVLKPRQNRLKLRQAL